MNPNGPSKLPFDVGPPGKPPAQTPMSSPVATEGKIPGYMDPFSKCANCEYFDGDSMCRKFDAPADMDGTCPSFEAADAGGSDEEAEETGAEFE